MNDDELTPSERKALDSLPREGAPDGALEDRTVRSLRRRGLLREWHGSGITLSPAWAALAAAAAVALALGGFALGQWEGSRQTTKAMLAMQKHDGLGLAAEVQRTGTAYVTALNTLFENLQAQDPEVQAQGRQVAISALYAAADLVVNIAPDEPAARSILSALERPPGPPAGRRARPLDRFVWF